MKINPPRVEHRPSVFEVQHETRQTSLAHNSPTRTPR